MTEDQNLAIQVVNIDYCMFKAERSIGFIEEKEYALPAIRIFGSTSFGIRACIYIHGVWERKKKKLVISF